MCSPRLLFVLVLSTSLSLAQPSKKTDALHEFSNSLQNLALKVNRGVVKIVSVGYTLGAEEEESTNTAVLSRQRSLGTGFVLTSDGYIVTNAHVVQGSRLVHVQLPASEQEIKGKNSVVKPSGKMIDAKIVGVDRETDVAVLKVDKTGLSHLDLGD